MKQAITRLLLPLTLDSEFDHGADMAVQIARDNDASITLAVIDDDSPSHVIADLPFHAKEFVHGIAHSEEIANGALNDRAARFLTETFAEKVEASEVLAVGHAATQILLLSRFHDMIVLSGAAQFPRREFTADRRANPLLEILDQTVTPVLLTGTNSVSQIKSASIIFDGGPCATHALQSFGVFLANRPETQIIVRVCLIEEAVARRLAREVEAYLRSKGFTNVKIEYSEKDPIEAITASDDFSPTDLVAMGVRSRNMFHDLRVGVLAKHFIDEEPAVHRLFC